jgi:DNA-binding transcriptional ArsR family regulator
MTDHDFIFAPPTVTVNFSLEPVRSILNSMVLVGEVEHRSGFSEWIDQTRAALSPDDLKTYRMVFEAFYPGIMQLVSSKDWRDFPDFVDYLAQQDPSTLRDLVINHLSRRVGIDNIEPLLDDRTAFIDAIYQALQHKLEKYEVEFDPEPFADAHSLLNRPAAVQQVVVDHLHSLWQRFFRDEWQRVLPMLQESIDAFQRVDFSGMTALEVVRAVTGRDIAGAWPELDTAESLTFVPSAHVGPYIGFYATDTANHLFYGARVPEGTTARTPALSRSELVVRMSALADDTRLAILELLAEQEELCAQDIMNVLNLSQSSASRHLRQLTATGYLVERRRDVAKCYSLNTKRFDDTLEALRHFLRS